MTHVQFRLPVSYCYHVNFLILLKKFIKKFSNSANSLPTYLLVPQTGMSETATAVAVNSLTGPSAAATPFGKRRFVSSLIQAFLATLKTSLSWLNDSPSPDLAERPGFVYRMLGVCNTAVKVAAWLVELIKRAVILSPVLLVFAIILGDWITFVFVFMAQKFQTQPLYAIFFTAAFTTAAILALISYIRCVCDASLPFLLRAKFKI